MSEVNRDAIVAAESQIVPLKVREAPLAVKCPVCGLRTLLATVPTTWIPLEDGMAALWGDPSAATGWLIREGGAQLWCNSVTCGWEGKRVEGDAPRTE